MTAGRSFYSRSHHHGGAGGSGVPAEVTSSRRRHHQGSRAAASSSNVEVFEDDDDDDDDDGGLVDLCDVDEADIASYVYPSSKRSAAHATAVVSTAGTGTRGRYGRQHSAPAATSSSSAQPPAGYDTVLPGPTWLSGSPSHTSGYDTVDTSRVQRRAGGSAGQRSGADSGYEKVVTSSCRYVHIWQMPLPKAPDE